MAAPIGANMDMFDQNKDAFYALLMVDRKATTAEINTAYKKLSLQFHPDKHTSPEAKKSAEKLFNKIKRARDDPHLRCVYDAVGLEGLKEFENSQLVRKDMKSSKEIVEEYKRLLELKRFQEELNSYSPHAKTVVQIDMSPIFDSHYFDEEYADDVTALEQFSEISMSQMSLSHDLTVPVGDNDECSISSQISVDFEKDHKSGHMECQYHKRLMNKTIRCGLVLGSSTQLSVNAYWAFMRNWSVNSNISCTILQGTLIPGLSTGTIGNAEAIKYGMHYSGEDYSVSGEIQAGIAFFQVGHSPNRLNFRIYKKFKEHDVSVKLISILSLTSAKMRFGVTKQFPSRQTMINSTLDLDTLNGVKLDINVHRGRHEFRFPLKLSSEIQPASTLYGLLLPVAVYSAIRALLVLPYMAERRKALLDKKKEEEKVVMEQKKADALEEIALMSSAVEQSIEEENSKSGLIIVKALFGRLQLVEESGEVSDEVINVTIPLQNQVRNSSLKLPAELSKVSIPGFYDPCFGEEKTLYIRYKFRDQLHQVTLSDTDPIYIPKQSHLISSHTNG